MKIKKKLRLYSSILVLVSILSNLCQFQIIDAASPMVITIGESTSISQSKVITIPNLVSIASMSVDTGTVSYSRSGNNVTISVNNGAVTRTDTPSSPASDYLQSSTDSFASTKSYSSGGYSGTLTKSGTSYVCSGSSSGSKTATDSLTSTASTTYRWSGSSWSVYSSYSPNNPTISYSDAEGYTGTLSKTGATKGTESGNPPSNPTIGTTYTHYTDWHGSYSGTVSKPDTRVYQQNYSGTVYAASVKYYKYNVTVNYTQTSLNAPGNMTVNSSYSSVSWGAVANASSYLVSLRDTSNNVLLLSRVTTASTSYSLPTLQLGTNYRFAVSGQTTNYEETWSLLEWTTPILPTIALSSPQYCNSYSVGTTIQIAGTGTNCSSIVAYVNGTSIGEVSGNSYNGSFTISNTSSYDIYLVGYSSTGNSVYSTTVTVVGEIPHTHSYTIYQINSQHTSIGHEIRMYCSSGDNSYIVTGYTSKSDCSSCTTAPSATIVPTQFVNAFSGNETNFQPQILVYDDENDTLTCKYFIDNATTPTGVEIVTQTKPYKTVTFATGINIANLTEGVHKIDVQVKDSIAPVGTASATFTVDKTPPVISAGTAIEVSTRNIKFTTVASDPFSGLNDSAYLYSINNEDVTTWVAISTFSSPTTLIPNSIYNYKIQVRDKINHVATTSGSICTLAEPSTVTLATTTARAIEVTVADTNPVDTEYSVKVGNLYVNASGTTQDGISWFPLTNKKLLINGLVAKTSYQVTVISRNRNLISSASSPVVSIETLPLPPSAPTTIAAIGASTTTSSAVLTWSASEGATKYDVMRDSTKMYENVTSPFADTGLEINSTHTYQVRAVNTGGSSTWSAITTVKTMPNPPALVTNLTGSAIDGKLALTWAIEPNSEYYEIKTNNTIITTTSASIQIPYSQLDVRTNVQCTINVRGRNGGGIGQWSSDIITYSAAKTPANLEIKSSTYNSVTFKWNNNGNPDYTNYKLHVYCDDSEIYDEVFDCSDSSCEYTIPLLDPIRYYSVEIAAENEDSVLSNWTDKVDFTLPQLLPASPTQIRTTAKDTQINLFWEPVENADYYVVQRNNVTLATNVTSASITDTGLNPSTSYTYQVAAVNDAGQSNWSSPLVKTTLGVMPITPINIVVTAHSESLDVSWGTVANITAYEIEVDGVITSTDLQNNFTQNGLIPGSYHTIRVRTRNTNGRSEWSTPIAKQTIPSIPAIPTNLTDEVTDTQMDISWNNVEGASSYEVWVNGTVYSNIISTELMLDNLTPNTTYTYKVHAKNAGGTSDWSQINVVNTLETPINAPILSVIADQDTITLTWTSILNAIRYELEADGTVYNLGLFNNYQVNDLNPGESHNGRIRAIFATGNGDWSILKTIETIPNSPEITSKVEEQNTITIRWNSVIGAAIYQLEADGQVIYTGANKEFTHTSLLANTAHTYRVSAGNSSGYSDYCNLTTAHTKKEVDLVPKDLIQSKINNGKITVSWAPVSNISGYKVEINGVAVTTEVAIAQTIISVLPNTSYTVRVASITNPVTKTLSEYSEAYTFVTPPAIPAKPILYSMGTTSNKITLGWAGVTNATGYDISVDGKIYDLGFVTTFKHDGLLAETLHTYKLRSYNESGKSAWTSNYTMTTEIGVPGAPKNIRIVDQSTDKAGIKIYWNSIANATSYNILFNGLDLSIGNRTNFPITGLEFGTLYNIQVKAVVNGVVGPWSSNIAYYTPFKTITAITPSAINGAISLSWNSLVGATGYDVEMDGVLLPTTTTASITTTLGSPYLTHAFRVRPYNAFETGEWSQVFLYNQNKTATFDVVGNQEFSIFLPVTNVKNMNRYKVSLLFNTEELLLLDACELTPEAELTSQYVSSNNIQLVFGQAGATQELTMITNIDSAEGQYFTGTLNSLRFLAKKTGKITITYKVEYLD